MIENNNQDEWIFRNNDGDLHGQELILDRKLDEILSDTDLLAFRKIMLKSCYKKPGPWYYRSLWIAATLLVLVSLGAVWLIVIRPGQADMTGLAKTYVKPGGDTISKAGEKTPMISMTVKPRPGPENRTAQEAENESSYVPLVYLERLCGESLRAEHLTIISPLPGAEFKKKSVIRFEWEANVGSGCILEILNNRGNVITRMETGRSGMWMFNAESFSRGVYYWKLLDHENLLYVGKFFLK